DRIQLGRRDPRPHVLPHLLDGQAHDPADLAQPLQIFRCFDRHRPSYLLRRGGSLGGKTGMGKVRTVPSSPLAARVRGVPSCSTSSIRRTACIGRYRRLAWPNSLRRLSSLGSTTTSERAPKTRSSTSMKPNRLPWTTWRA